MTTPTIPYLTPAEAERVAYYRARYSIEAWGFGRAEADRLLFWRWLVRTGRLVGDTEPYR